jgi:hypothetical protein
MNIRTNSCFVQLKNCRIIGQIDRIALQKLLKNASNIFMPSQKIFSSRISLQLSRVTVLSDKMDSLVSSFILLYIWNEGKYPPFSSEREHPMSLRFLSEGDLQAIAAKGIHPTEILRQLEMFRRGVEPIKLIRPARIGDGIVQVIPEEKDTLVSLHDQAAGAGRMLKFVPASGAASRMFKDWQSCYRQGRFDSDESSVKFLQDIVKFAFYDDLKQIMASDGQTLEDYIHGKRCADILEYILTPKGLNYAWLPKALLKFHTYPGRNRTAMEEHLVEAAFYVRDDRNICKIHFTLSEEHESQFKDTLYRVKSDYENLFGVNYKVDVTIQLASTDTIATDMEGWPLRDRSGKILFRPGGHGALLQNLNDMDGDIIFVKNIDNVVPDRLKEITVLYKKVLGGYLIRLQNEIFRVLNLLKGGRVNEAELSQIIYFCRKELCLSFPPGFRNSSASTKRKYIFQKLNRPLRVCGMVQNEREPGGGPFWTEETDGTQSLQIVELNQIDPYSEGQQDIWRSSTHFNPVDLVCGVRNYRGEKFDLNLYADRNAVSISTKPHENGKIKALELPGLWNGAMAFWNTVFLEVPLETFNPVKAVDDLLRKSHLLL